MKIRLDWISSYNAILLYNLTEDVMSEKVEVIIDKDDVFSIKKLLNAGFIIKKENKKTVVFIID